ncbi:hypothetical protein [Bosea sp. NBC_00550]|uniref:hypothetical protein n=1 Tax=Bosea sp. NBC_00550 TaxID=2969621 RepID=UPI002231F5D3|nr:hypothetical protein [Bosea sp. NBC_00550]UZF93180.1 hypothetical protein NWE53_02905 [Bosea sp. NBC_00550]
MNAPSVISPAAARLPQTYESAKNALAECVSLDECKSWADEAAALASYAKQADDEELMRMATRIRARAVRRAGELLKQLDGQGNNQHTVGVHVCSRSARPPPTPACPSTSSSRLSELPTFPPTPARLSLAKESATENWRRATAARCVVE